MAKSQENGTTILLGLKGYQVGRVSEEEGEILVEVRAGLEKLTCRRPESQKRSNWYFAPYSQAYDGFFVVRIWSPGKAVI